LPQITKRLPCVCRGVRATQTSEFPIVESLRAKTRALDTKVAKRPEHLRSHGSGIHFHGNFGIRLDVEAKLNRLKNSFHLGWRKQRRSAATKIDGVYVFRVIKFIPGSDLSGDRVDIALRNIALVDTCSKVTVRATGAAEWDVNINAGEIHSSIHRLHRIYKINSTPSLGVGPRHASLDRVILCCYSTRSAESFLP